MIYAVSSIWDEMLQIATPHLIRRDFTYLLKHCDLRLPKVLKILATVIIRATERSTCLA